MYIQNYKAKVDHVAAYESQIRTCFLNIFPSQNLGHSLWVLIFIWIENYYSIFVLQIHFFLENLEFQLNLENIYPTLTILKVA